MKRLYAATAALYVSLSVVVVLWGCSKKTLKEGPVLWPDEPVVEAPRDTTPEVESFEDALPDAPPLPDDCVLYYDFDVDAIRPAEAGKLDRLARELSGRYDYRLYLTGGACPIGPEAYNDELGLRRAKSAATWLIERGIPSSAILVRSVGENALVSDTDLELNRRCEVDVQ